MQSWKGDDSKPVVSVCCVTYNHENYISDAMDGFLMQETDFPFEIIVRDDCSTDRTQKIVVCYRAVKLFKNDRHTGGPNVGRNLGMKHAKGEYVAFLDQDDEWMPGKLKKQLEEISNGADLVSSRSIIKLEKRKV